MPHSAILPLPVALVTTAAQAELRLWLIDLSAEPAQADWLACSAQEQARAARFRFELHARRYRAAHAATRQILAQALNVAAADVCWQDGSHGKPHLQGHPGWHFNLSHSDDWALLGLNHGAPIGVDVEWCKATRDLGALAAYHFTSREQSMIAQAAEAERVTLFYRVWSRKEACLKALGSGLSIEPQCFEAGAHFEAQDTFIPLGIQNKGAPGPQAACRMTVWSVALPVGAQAAVAVLAPGDAHLAW